MQSFLLTGRPPVKTGHQLPNGVWSGRMFRMKRTIRILAGLVACRAVSVLGQVPSPESPWEMAVATERWLVEGAGARFLPGMDDPARDGNTFVFVDESWPAAFQARVGDAVYLRISPTTGCYDFEDADGNVFWTIVPYAPLTWNWISPFRSPLHPDEQNLYSPFRLVREWRLTTPEIEEMRMAPMRRPPLRSTPPEPVTNLCFTAFSITNDVLFFTVDWPTNNVLPESTLDLYGTSNLASRTWSFLSSHPATNRPASFSVPMTALPWYDPVPPHVHGEACGVSTNIVLSPLDGGIVYTNVVYECGVSDPPRPLGFFNLGTRNDTDGDGLSDGDEVARGTDPLLWDTDGDGLFDGDEAASGMDPATPNGDDEAFDADSDGDGLTNAEEFQIGTDWSVEDTDGDGVSDGIEWSQGSDPLDSADFSVRPGVDVTLKFGDNSGSHSERYEATVKPAGGDTRRPFTLRNGTFGVADSFTVRLVANAWYDISLRHVASSLAQPDLDYTLTVIPYNSLSGTASLVLDPGGLLGNHSNVYASQFDGTARVAIVHARILADKNRDGVIDEADNTPDPLRMWINDDREDGSIASGESDVPAPSFLGHTYGNATDDHVNGMSDFEDYFPVWLDVAESITLLQSLYPDSRVSVHLSQHDAAVGIVNTDLTRMTAGQYLRDPTIAAGYASSTDVIVSSAGVEYPASDLSRLTGNSGKGVSLIEGLKSSKRPLVLELRKDGSTVLSTSLELSISSVESFYRWINLRGVVGGDVSRSTDTREPQNFPDEESNGKSVVFVHGFNVTEREARGWHAEMFKRLWQSGCSSRYYAVTWNGDEGFPNGLFYHENVVNAFLTAPAFATSFSGNVANTAVLAHSLGNMVVCSAIQDHGCLPSQYFMLDSAVAAESLDATQWDDSSFCNPMLHEEWFGYPGGCWCSRWHQLFSVNDVRQKLTWIDRFGDVPDRTELFNYYSTGDEVLCLYETPDANGIGTITVEGGTGGSIGYHPWQKQERFKGRFGVDAWLGNAGTSEMGWGFSGIGFWENGEPPMYDESIGLGALYGIPARLSQYTATQAVNATSEQLVADPVFRHSPETILSGGNQSQSQIDALLARGVPALSGPVGSRAILLNSSVVNTDMNSKRVSVGWPRNSEPEFTGWRHGDIKAVAFPFVHRVFDDILQSLEANK